MRHLLWLALFAAATTAAAPDDRAAEKNLPAEIVDVAALETSDAPVAAKDELAEPLRRIAEELDRTLEDQRGPAWDAPEVPEGDFVAAAP